MQTRWARLRRTLAAAMFLASGAAVAQSVALTGTMGERALLVIDGSDPQVLRPGETRQGVTLISAGNDAAVIEMQGQRQNLRVGESPVSLESHGDGAKRIVLPVGTGGHFYGTAMINGRSVPFLIDTGATNVVISASIADRLGLAYRSSPRTSLETANGKVAGWRSQLDIVRVGAVDVYQVQAEIVPNGTNFILLGNSFLSHFRMSQEDDRLVLEKRY